MKTRLFQVATLCEKEKQVVLLRGEVLKELINRSYEKEYTDDGDIIYSKIFEYEGKKLV